MVAAGEISVVVPDRRHGGYWMPRFRWG